MLYKCNCNTISRCQQCHLLHKKKKSNNNGNLI
jgi:hypothetical protein